MGIVLFSNPSKVVRDKRVINAILRRAAKKNNVPEGIKLEASPWGYIEIYRTAADAPKINHLWDSFSNVEYKGKKYESKYFDGCFKPYVVEM